MKRLLMVFLIVLALPMLVVSADWTYTVKNGDTLYKIAKKVGVSESKLKSRNGLSGNKIKVGQRLTIPTGGKTDSVKVNKPVKRGGTDVELLAKVIQAEAGAEPYLGKVAVGGVIMNRIQNSQFPKTMAAVVYQPHAFESVSNGTIYKPVSADARKAAQAAVSGWDPSGGALYFFNPAKTNNAWIWARKIINRIGNHVFAL